MGCLGSGSPSNRDRVHSSTSRIERDPFFNRQSRSSFTRFFKPSWCLYKARCFLRKLHYRHWISVVLTFLLIGAVCQLNLPAFADRRRPSWGRTDVSSVPEEFTYVKGIGGLDFGPDVKFEPSELLEKLRREGVSVNSTFVFNRTRERFGYRQPQLALVFGDLVVDPHQLLMVTVAMAFREVGYEVQVYSLEEGPVSKIWHSIGMPVTVLQPNRSKESVVDWLKYDGILVDSLQAKSIFRSLTKEPFKSVPLVWTIHEETLAIRASQYNSTGQIELLNDWKRNFNRASVVVFPNQFLMMGYSMFDAGNFYVIPGSPAEAWKGDTIQRRMYKDDTRLKIGFEADDFVIALVGSQFLYKGLWLEHALVLQALLPLFSAIPRDNNTNSHLKIIVLSGGSSTNYSMALEAITLHLKFPRGAVKHVKQVAVEDDIDAILSIADLVIYGSFMEEISFPEILMRAMRFEKPIIAPDLPNIKRYVDDRMNGYLFPNGDMKALTKIAQKAITKGKLSPEAHNIGLIGRYTVKNLMVRETVEGYILVLENIIYTSSEVSRPKLAKNLPADLKEEWQWHFFEGFLNSSLENSTLRSFRFLSEVEEQWKHVELERRNSTDTTDDLFTYEIWEEEGDNQIANYKKRLEDEEIKYRTDQPRGTWEEVYRNAKKADRSKNDLHERDERELERTGQPLCIYESYLGEGTWPFLHTHSLYRGIGLSTKGRRPSMDDVDAPSRLQLLNDPYYRDSLGEYGAFFAISNRIDRIHKNSWIGFQSWRATARKESLSKNAENAILNAIQTRGHGDKLYFWARMDNDPRNPLKQNFWSFCDAINAGNCRFAFTETLKKMYGLKYLDSLPPMPEGGGTWCVMQSWALPTRSFLEFVMFSRMFVDALDAQMYDVHRETGMCYLSLTRDKHCYSRMLELLVNVWAYHSARRMVYVNAETGLMEEVHKLKSRRGKMWIKWFQYSTLKSMDEDLAEEADSERPSRHWLWPSTGEIVWQGSIEKEKQRRSQEKERRKQRSKDKLNRMRIRSGRQKVIGKYVKPQPEVEDSNTTEYNNTTALDL